MLLDIASKVQLYVWPAVNPDGLNFIEENEVLGEEIALKRKNNRQTGDCDGVHQGVDLNRNYDVSVLPADSDHKDLNPCGHTYRGPEPFSEPETRAMRDFVLKHKNTLKFTCNYH